MFSLTVLNDIVVYLGRRKDAGCEVARALIAELQDNVMVKREYPELVDKLNLCNELVMDEKTFFSEGHEGTWIACWVLAYKEPEPVTESDVEDTADAESEDTEPTVQYQVRYELPDGVSEVVRAANEEEAQSIADRSDGVVERVTTETLRPQTVDNVAEEVSLESFYIDYAFDTTCYATTMVEAPDIEKALEEFSGLSEDEFMALRQSAEPDLPSSVSRERVTGFRTVELGYQPACVSLERLQLKKYRGVTGERLVSRREIAESYPGLSMLPVDPQSDTLVKDAKKCGDTLFLFIMKELHDGGYSNRDIEVVEAIRRLDAAIDDLTMVRAQLIDNWRRAVEDIQKQQRGNTDA